MEVRPKYDPNWIFLRADRVTPGTIIRVYPAGAAPFEAQVFKGAQLTRQGTTALRVGIIGADRKLSLAGGTAITILGDQRRL